MHTASSLLEALELTHRGTDTLLEHCRQFSAEDLHREIDGFGYPTLQRQLHHIFEAEQYWIDVLADRFKDYDQTVTEDIAWRDYPTADAIIIYGQRVREATRELLASVSDELLNAPAEFLTWPDNRRLLIPARVLLRLVTHPFHHRGQAAAICRILGRPVPPMDFPIAPDA